MSETIPEDAQRLATRLRMAADEIESAARYGVPIPFSVSVSGHEYGGLSASMTDQEFEAWVTYTEAPTEDYDYQGASWSSARVDVNGLPVSMSVKHAVTS